MARTPKETTSEEPSSFESALAELEQLVSAMEGGQMPLDSLLDSYRRGALLLDYCRGRLKSVEDQVKVLDGALLKPWVDA